MAELRSGGTPIGRSTETVALERVIEDVAGGDKRAVVLRGAPDTGKTALLYWAHDLTTHSGFACALVRTPATAGVPPRFPLSEVLSALLQDRVAKGYSAPQLLLETAEAFGRDAGRATQPARPSSDHPRDGGTRSRRAGRDPLGRFPMDARGRNFLPLLRPSPVPGAASLRRDDALRTCRRPRPAPRLHRRPARRHHGTRRLESRFEERACGASYLPRS